MLMKSIRDWQIRYIVVKSGYDTLYCVGEGDIFPVKQKATNNFLKLFVFEGNNFRGRFMKLCSF